MPCDIPKRLVSTEEEITAALDQFHDHLEAGGTLDEWDEGMIRSKSPSPGSKEAIALGCQCAVRDNARGAGYMSVPGVYVMTVGCPVHDRPKDGEDGPCL